MITYRELKNNLEKPFYINEEIVDGFKVATFSYWVGSATWNNFTKEMRWSSFIFEEWKNPKLITFPFQKFFNYWEREEELNFFETKEIESVLDKEDGSLISIALFPNGKLYAKSKSGYLNEVAQLWNSCITENIDKLCRELISNNHSPIFELVGKDNVIVCSKNKLRDNQLILIGARNFNTGKTMSFSELKNFANQFNVPTVQEFKITLEEIKERIKTNEEDEWVIIVFTDWSRLKIKFEDYLFKHKTKDIKPSKEFVLDKLIEDNFDDFISFLKTNDLFEEKFNEILEIKKLIDLEVDDLIKLIEKAKKDFNMETKDFYQKYKDFLMVRQLCSLKRWNIEEIETIEIYKAIKKRF